MKTRDEACFYYCYTDSFHTHTNMLSLLFFRYPSLTPNELHIYNLYEPTFHQIAFLPTPFSRSFFASLHLQVNEVLMTFLPSAADPLHRTVRERLTRRLLELHETLLRSKFFWVRHLRAIGVSLRCSHWSEYPFL